MNTCTPLNMVGGRFYRWKKCINQSGYCLTNQRSTPVIARRVSQIPSLSPSLLLPALCAKAFQFRPLPSSLPFLVPSIPPSRLPLALIATADKETHSQRTVRGGLAAALARPTLPSPPFISSSPPSRSATEERNFSELAGKVCQRCEMIVLRNHKLGCVSTFFITPRI